MLLACILVVVGKREVVSCCLKVDTQRKQQQKLLMVQEVPPIPPWCVETKKRLKKSWVVPPQQTNRLEAEFIHPISDFRRFTSTQTQQLEVSILASPSCRVFVHILDGCCGSNSLKFCMQKLGLKMVKLGNYILFGFWPFGAFSLLVVGRLSFKIQP